MKTKTAYFITAHRGTTDHSQHLLPKELHLIKTMLNDKIIITGIAKVELPEYKYKILFG
jgi:hypothetical protein